MSATWNYAQHSKMVAEHGGPELFVKAVKSGAFDRGLAIGAAAGAAVGGLVAYGVERYRRRQALAAAAEQALLAEMP